MHLLPTLLAGRARRLPPPASTLAVPWAQTVCGAMSVPVPAPEPVLTLRLRPRRLPAPLPDAGVAGSACGWHESSRDLRQGLVVTECAGWPLWADARGASAQRAGAL